MTGIPSPVRSVARSFGVRRASVAELRMRFERSVLAATTKARPAATGRILCYHSIGTPQWGVNDVTEEQFREHIDVALRLGYRFVPAEAIAAGGCGPTDLALTFDDGLLSVADFAAPILAGHGIPWSVFIVADWADGRHDFGEGVVMGWSDIERLAARGVEIGSHSKSHPDFGSLGPDAARRELLESRRTIEQRTGLSVGAFAIPLGQSRNWSTDAQAASVEAAYERVYAQSVLNRPPGTVARTFITRGDDRGLFRAALNGAFDAWDEWA